MKLLYFFIFAVAIMILLPLLRYHFKYVDRQQYVEGFENSAGEHIPDPNKKYELTIDLIDEFKRLRFLLDKYDNEAVKYPGDADLAKRRTALEHMLTKIVVYIQREGHKISVDNAKELLRR
jgi:hypothetical protein